MNSAAALAAPRRFNSTVARSLKEQPQSKIWLSDPGSYPIIVILGGATMGWIGFLGYKFMYWYVDMHTHTHEPPSTARLVTGSMRLTYSHALLLFCFGQPHGSRFEQDQGQGPTNVVNRSGRLFSLLEKNSAA
jgi:hypothetical protein